MIKTFRKIDECDALLVKLRAEKNVETMSALKAEVDVATKMVEDKEQLASKLEPEIVQWDPLGKLVRRDEELDHVAAETAAIDEYLRSEENFVEQQMAKLETDEAKDDGKDKKHTVAISLKKEGLMALIQDVEELARENDDLIKDHDEVQGEFDQEIPKLVFQARTKRQAMNHKKATGNQSSPSGKMTEAEKADIYVMVSTNCKHRPPIKEMLAKVRELRAALDSYENKWAKLKMELNAKVVKKKYKAVKGDMIDEMFAEALNRSNYADLKVIRLEQGKYMFGTKKILAKIINNKLVIRVGGGYMSVDEFIEQYGRMELMKMIAAEEAEKGLPLAGV